MTHEKVEQMMDQLTRKYHNKLRVLASGLDYMQGNIWDQIQQDNAYLVDRHPRIVQHVKLVR
jgi:hypothetical protein